MDFLKLEGKWVLVTGVANRRSIAWHVAQGLREAGARVLFLFRDRELLEQKGARQFADTAEELLALLEAD